MYVLRKYRGKGAKPPYSKAIASWWYFPDPEEILKATDGMVGDFILQQKDLKGKFTGKAIHFEIEFERRKWWQFWKLEYRRIIRWKDNHTIIASMRQEATF